MPKATRANGSTTPKKRSRKSTPESGNGVHAEQPLATSPEIDQQVQGRSSLEERIRARAYELYLQRGGNGGSPEQDWLTAQQEICAPGA